MGKGRERRLSPSFQSLHKPIQTVRPRMARDQKWLLESTSIAAKTWWMHAPYLACIDQGSLDQPKKLISYDPRKIAAPTCTVRARLSLHVASSWTCWGPNGVGGMGLSRMACNRAKEQCWCFSRHFCGWYFMPQWVGAFSRRVHRAKVRQVANIYRSLIWLPVVHDGLELRALGDRHHVTVWWQTLVQRWTKDLQTAGRPVGEIFARLRVLS